jgi:hypothetical protein
VSAQNLAVSYSNLGRHAEALKLDEQTLALCKTRVGHDHPQTLVVMEYLAIDYQNLDRNVEALKLREERLALTRAKFGPDDPATLNCMGGIAESLVRCDRGSEAVPLIDDCVRRAEGKAVDPALLPTLFDQRLRHFEKNQDSSRCRDTAQMWEQLNRTDPVSLYSAACYRAVTAAVLRAKDESDEAGQSVTAEADQAMDWLAKSVTAGYSDVSHIEKDKDLDALREREDFKKLLEELQVKQKRTSGRGV